jgi:PqqD family protein of HPr-rel-A system
VRPRQQDVEWQIADDEIVVLDLRTTECLELNSSAAEIWRGLIEDEDEQALAERVSREFDVEPDRAAADVSAFLASLRERGLLEEGA